MELVVEAVWNGILQFVFEEQREIYRIDNTVIFLLFSSFNLLFFVWTSDFQPGTQARSNTYLIAAVPCFLPWTISFRNSEALFPRTLWFPWFSPKVLNAKGHCGKSDMNKQTWALGPNCMRNETRKPSSPLVWEETGAIHHPFSPKLFKLYDLQLHIHCAILPKIHMVFSRWGGAAPATRQHPLPRFPGFLPLHLLSCSLPRRRPSRWALPSIQTPLPACRFPPLIKVRSPTYPPCRSIPLFLSHPLAPLPSHSESAPSLPSPGCSIWHRVCFWVACILGSSCFSQLWFLSMIPFLWNAPQIS